MATRSRDWTVHARAVPEDSGVNRIFNLVPRFAAAMATYTDLPDSMKAQ
jgi:hypothetical protein